MTRTLHDSRTPSLPRPVLPVLVAIVGGSGAGKSWLADKLQAALGGRAARFSLDDFYRDRSHLSLAQRARVNFDHPRAIDWLALDGVLRDLLAGHPTRLPCYDFKTHCRLHATKLLKPKPIVLMDGLWLLRRPSLRRLFSLRIFLDCPTRTRLRRRFARDLLARGRTRVSIRQQFWNMVEPMHQQFVASQARWADVILKPGSSTRDLESIAAELRKRVECVDRAQRRVSRG